MLARLLIRLLALVLVGSLGPVSTAIAQSPNPALSSLAQFQTIGHQRPKIAPNPWPEDAVFVEASVPVSVLRLSEEDRANAQPLVDSAEIAPEKPHEVTGFLDFNLYPYISVASENVLTINALANLDHGFQYFSLTNFGSDPSSSALEDANAILTEQNLRWQLPNNIPFAIAAQALLRTGPRNDALRIGPRFALHDTTLFKCFAERCNLQYWIAVYGAQFNHMAGYQWQLEHVFQWKVFPKLFDERVYLAGFADHNIDHSRGTQSTWLVETQLGIRVVDQWHFITEQRYNGFRRGSESSIGVGVEYIIKY